MFDNGFIIGRHADLSWHGAADARRLAILLAAAAAAAMLGSHTRGARQGPLPAPDPVTAVDTDQGILDGQPFPAARVPAAALPAVTTAASDKPDDDRIQIGRSRLAA
jgi:hypothetical protein